MSDPVKEIKKALKEEKLPPLYPDSANHSNDTNVSLLFIIQMIAHIFILPHMIQFLLYLTST